MECINWNKSFKGQIIPPSSLSKVPAMPVISNPDLGSELPSAAAASTFFIWASKRADGTSSLILANSSARKIQLK